MKPGTRVRVTRKPQGRPRPGNAPTTYDATVIKLNGNMVCVQCDNNGPRVWVGRERCTPLDAALDPARYLHVNRDAEIDPAACTQAEGAS